MTDGLFLLSLAILIQWYYWALLCVVLTGLSVIVFLVLKKKHPKIRTISDELIDDLLKHLGGIDNIAAATQDGARLKFTIVDVDRCQLDQIRNLGAVGIFVSGNQVKFMLPSNAERLIHHINELKKGNKS